MLRKLHNRLFPDEIDEWRHSKEWEHIKRPTWNKEIVIVSGPKEVTWLKK